MGVLYRLEFKVSARDPSGLQSGGGQGLLALSEIQRTFRLFDRSDRHAMGAYASQTV